MHMLETKSDKVIYRALKGQSHKNKKYTPWFTHPKAVLGLYDFLLSDEAIRSYILNKHPGSFKLYNAGEWVLFSIAQKKSNKAHPPIIKSSQLYLYSAFYDTDCVKAALQYHTCPWSTDAVLSSTAIFVAIANNTLYGSKLFLLKTNKSRSAHI